MGSQISTRVKVIRPDEAPGDDSNEQRPNSSLGLQSDDPSINSSVSFAGRESGHRSSIQRQETEASKGTILCTPALGSGYELEDSDGNRKPLSEDVLDWFQRRNRKTLEGSLAFVPWILQQSYFDGGLEEGSVVTHRGSGAVVFSDASGFTALTERLAKKSNGAELLSQCLTAFFTPLINLINAYRGDVIKFSGDALTIYFPAVDDTTGPRSTSKMQVPPHGSYGLPDLGPMTTAVLRASACCLEIHKRLHMFDTGVDDVRLCLHIGVGCGQVTILQVGGVVPPETHVARCEYLIAGPPIEQISIAEPLAKNGETCLSPQAWDHVRGCVVEDTSRALDDRPEYHLLLKMDESKYTFPTIKYSAMERDTRREKQFALTELSVIRRYIPSAVFKQIEGGTLTYVNEMRTISTIFISGSGVDVSTDAGALVAQELMASVQRICYAMEGTLNKFVIDDKGMLFLLVYGLPPLVHTDDPTRAVLSCFEMVKMFKRLDLTGKFGVTTGRAYCGCCGSAQRMEYTVLGDVVNLSARLMANAPKDDILTDETTKIASAREVQFSVLAPIRVKGKSNPISIYQPRPKDQPQYIGLGPHGKIHFPWYERPLQLSKAVGGEDETSAPNKKCQFKANVTQICDLPGWEGINKLQNLLGGKYSAELHRRQNCTSTQAATASRDRPPASSPFSNGGVVTIVGATGMGKIELAEHLVVHAATQLHMMPVFGSIGPTLNDQERLGVELLRSTVGVFRLFNSSLPESDLDALTKLIPGHLHGILPEVKEAFAGQIIEERRITILMKIVDLFCSLLEILREQTALVIVLQLEHGTSLFEKTLKGLNCFWTVVSRLTKVAMPQGGTGSGGDAKPIVLAILAQEADSSTHPTIKTAINKGWHIELKGLPEDACNEYMCTYLGVPKSMMPHPLQQFIQKISLGNPLYIRETIDQMLIHEHIKLHFNSAGAPESLQYHQDLEGINIADWGQTAMVGETICLLESLDPLQAAVLKMSTVFTGTFSLPDLASSSCSRWAGATHFDYLRLFKAIQDLVKRHILEVAGSNRSATDLVTPKLQVFEVKNVLIRKVGAYMLLEAQKKVVKRQALIDRTLSRDLPARMEAVYSKRLEPHIPWYYESVLTNKGA